MNVLEPKLKSVIRHVLWELVMDKISLVYPLFEDDSGMKMNNDLIKYFSNGIIM